jgi:hypothetical protein
MATLLSRRHWSKQALYLFDRAEQIESGPAYGPGLRPLGFSPPTNLSGHVLDKATHLGSGPAWKNRPDSMVMGEIILARNSWAFFSPVWTRPGPQNAHVHSLTSTRARQWAYHEINKSHTSDGYITCYLKGICYKIHGAKHSVRPMYDIAFSKKKSPYVQIIKKWIF